MKKNQKGTAIKYNREIPQIIANAKGKLLEKLLEIAKYNNITIYRDPDLAEVLSKLEVGTNIPEDLFFAISEVFAYCYRVNNDFKNKLKDL